MCSWHVLEHLARFGQGACSVGPCPSWLTYLYSEMMICEIRTSLVLKILFLLNLHKVIKGNYNKKRTLSLSPSLWHKSGIVTILPFNFLLGHIKGLPPCDNYQILGLFCTGPNSQGSHNIRFLLYPDFGELYYEFKLIFGQPYVHLLASRCGGWGSSSRVGSTNDYASPVTCGSRCLVCYSQSYHNQS